MKKRGEKAVRFPRIWRSKNNDIFKIKIIKYWNNNRKNLISNNLHKFIFMTFHISEHFEALFC
jgi:hypothetical protein